MKKLMTLLFAVIFTLAGCKSNNDVPVEIANIDEFVSKAVLEFNKGKFSEGEAAGEGHIILGTESDGENTVVYANTMFANFAFEDSNFVKISGHGVMPVKIVYDDNFELKEYIVPEDGSKRENSIKELIPKKYHEKVLKINQEEKDNLTEQTHKYAQEYLDSIGRQAIIGAYGDFTHTILTDLGVSVNASNEVSYGKYSKEKYPYWIGNVEYVEDGVRYVYEMSWIEEDVGVGTVKFSKYEYGTNNVVEEFIFKVNGEEAVYEKIR